MFTLKYLYNILNPRSSVQSADSCVLQGIGDMTLAYQCFKLALAFNNDHAEAYNNLAVLELRKGRVEQVNIMFIFFTFRDSLLYCNTT